MLSTPLRKKPLRNSWYRPAPYFLGTSLLFGFCHHMGRQRCDGLSGTRPALIQGDVVSDTRAIGLWRVGVDPNFVEDKKPGSKVKTFRQVMGDHEDRELGLAP